jgi:hypothetical protein
MDDFHSSKCPNCRHTEKETKMDDDGKFYVVCLSCGYQTPHFKFLAQAQANWIVGGNNAFSMPV